MPRHKHTSHAGVFNSRRALFFASTAQLPNELLTSLPAPLCSATYGKRGKEEEEEAVVRYIPFREVWQVYAAAAAAAFG